MFAMACVACKEMSHEGNSSKCCNSRLLVDLYLIKSYLSNLGDVTETDNKLH